EGRRALRRFWPTNRLDGANQKSRIVLQPPGLRPPGARGRLQRDRRVVRDAGQGGEVPRGPVRQGSPAGEVGVKRGFRQDGWRTGGEGAASSSPSAAAVATTMKLPIAQPDARDWADHPHRRPYDNPRFWDETHLEGEVHRVFEICNGCRLCFNLCPSFDVLFKRIDALDPHREEAEGKHLLGGMVEEHEAKKLLDQVEVHTESPVSLLDSADKERVVELCYECKLCFPKCPYV